MVFVDIDDTVVEVYSPKKQGAGIGYNNTRGLNALLVTASTAKAAPIIIGQQLRKGAAHSVRGAHKTPLRFVGDTWPVVWAECMRWWYELTQPIIRPKVAKAVLAQRCPIVSYGAAERRRAKSYCHH